MADQELWAVHVIGPDDVYAAASYEEALTRAQKINEWVVGRTDRHPYAPHMWAIPKLWREAVSSGTSEAHAAALERQRREERSR